MLTVEVLTFKRIVTAATHVLVANRLPISRQQVEVDIIFRTGQDDAEQQANVVGSVDSFSVKHQVVEDQERSHRISGMRA